MTESSAASTAATPTDAEQILAHIHRLFRAFVDKDRETIRRGHTTDWRGFQVRSTAMVRGLDAYMQAADDALRHFRGTRYELTDHDIAVHGDLAVVFYVARFWYTDDSGAEQELPLRSVDIYRREPGGWNQCGSNISVLPAP